MKAKSLAQQNKRQKRFAISEIKQRPHIWFSFGKWRYYSASGWDETGKVEAFVDCKNFELSMKRFQDERV